MKKVAFRSQSDCLSLWRGKTPRHRCRSLINYTTVTRSERRTEDKDTRNDTKKYDKRCELKDTNTTHKRSASRKKLYHVLAEQVKACNTTADKTNFQSISFVG